MPRVRLVGIPVGTEVDELRTDHPHDPHTRYPVYAGDFDHIVGSIHIKVLLRHLVTNGRSPAATPGRCPTCRRRRRWTNCWRRCAATAPTWPW